MSVTSAAVPDDGEGVVEVALEALSDGVTVRGSVTVPWEGECRRCLEMTGGTLSAPIDEVFKDAPDDGETLGLDGDSIDLGPVVHDAVILALPLAPLCRPGCPGPDPGQFPVAAEDVEGGEGAEVDAAAADEPDDAAVDPRWAALDELRFDSDAADG